MDKELDILQKRIHYANEMKSIIIDFIDGKGTLLDLKKAAEDYLNLPDIKTKQYFDETTTLTIPYSLTAKTYTR